MASETVYSPTPSWQRWIAGLGGVALRTGRAGATRVQRDWVTDRLWISGFATAILACALVAAFHLNRPLPFMPYHDAYEYVDAADRILSGGAWLDATRLPGYPLLLAAVFFVAGKDNLAAADAVQQFLFVVAAVETYALTYRVWRNARTALVVGALFSMNFYFFSYVKPILSDGLALVLTLTMALLALSCMERPSLRRFWPLAGCALALLLTRGEWVLFPIPLFAVLVWSARMRAGTRRLLFNAAASLGAIYAIVAGCVALNTRLSGYAGFTDAQEINLYGKVIQYHMQTLAPHRYAELAHLTDWYVTHGVIDPWYVYRAQPWLGANHFRLLGAYARAILLHHPVEFVVKSVPMAFRSLYEHWPFETYNPAGREAGLLNALQQFSAVVYPLFMLFPFMAAAWALVLIIRRSPALSARARRVCLVSGIALYDLIMTTLGSYGEYPRLHLSFDPLMLVVVVGTLMLLASARRGARPVEQDIGTTQVVGATSGDPGSGRDQERATSQIA